MIIRYHWKVLTIRIVFPLVLVSDYYQQNFIAEYHTPGFGTGWIGLPENQIIAPRITVADMEEEDNER